MIANYIYFQINIELPTKEYGTRPCMLHTEHSSGIPIPALQRSFILDGLGWDKQRTQSKIGQLYNLNCRCQVPNLNCRCQVPNLNCRCQVPNFHHICHTIYKHTNGQVLVADIRHKGLIGQNGHMS